MEIGTYAMQISVLNILQLTLQLNIQIGLRIALLMNQITTRTKIVLSCLEVAGMKWTATVVMLLELFVNR